MWRSPSLAPGNRLNFFKEYSFLSLCLNITQPVLSEKGDKEYAPQYLQEWPCFLAQKFLHLVPKSCKNDSGDSLRWEKIQVRIIRSGTSAKKCICADSYGEKQANKQTNKHKKDPCGYLKQEDQAYVYYRWTLWLAVGGLSLAHWDSVSLVVKWISVREITTA